MRIVIAAEGTRGDVHPMLALTRTLQGAGHTVVFCAPPDFGAEVLAVGARFVSLGSPVRDFLEQGAAAVHGGALAMVGEMVRWGRVSLENQFRVLPEAAEGCDYVLGAGTILAGASAAELHGVPYRAVVYTPAVLPSAEHTPCLLPVQLRSRWLNRLIWSGSSIGLGVSLRLDLNRRRRALGLPPVRDVVRHVLSPRPIVAVDRGLARVPADCGIATDQIRCLHPLGGEPLPPKVEAFLEQGPPPVYLGFGSMTDPDPAATTRRLLDAIDSLGCRAILSRGWAGLGEGPLPGHVLAVGPLSHASLFPRTAVVVHHGGAGTTHSAARAGVPQLVVPHVLDQFYFARRVEDLGVGAATRAAGKLDVERLRHALAALLGNDFVIERARALRDELADLGPVEPDCARLLDR